MNEIMSHECFSENNLLIPRLPQQLAASENPKSVQNSRHIGREAHDSNKIARNRLGFTLTGIQTISGYFVTVVSLTAYMAAILNRFWIFRSG